MFAKALGHSLRMTVAITLASVFLAACHDQNASSASAAKDDSAASAPAKSAAQIALEQRNALLDIVSGVWKPSEGNGLLTVYVNGNQAQMAKGDSAFEAKLGDVDPANGTVTVKIIAQGKEALRTLATLSQDETGSSLKVTDENGNEEIYSLVRRVSNDDLNRISRLGTSSVKAGVEASSAAPAQPATTLNRGVVDMYLGGIDMNLRSCPGSTCAPILIVPKDSKVSTDTSTIREVTETSGVNTPWVRVTYEGAYCTAAEQDSQTGCAPSHGTDAPVTGWMNYTRLLSAPRVQQ